MWSDQKPTAQQHQYQPIPKQHEEHNRPIPGPSTDRQPAQLQSVLSKQLGPEYLSTRAGAGGCKLTYIEGWRVIALANEVFGYDGWSSETKTIEVDFVDSVGDGKFNVGVSAVVRITLRNGSSHEDVGYGKIENCRSKADALDKCKKEAVTDALKRTLRTFGNLMGNCLYDKSYLNNVKTMQAQKEKFLPSKLYRPEHVATSSTGRASTTQAESKPSTDDVKPPVSRPPAPMLNNKPAQQTFAKPSSITIKPTPQVISSKPPIPQMAPKPAAQIVSKPAAPSRPVQAEVPKTTPPVAQKVTPADTPADKRKFQSEEEEEEESSTAEEQDETTSVEPLPATLSDKYFELDEHDLAELENAESIDLMLCMSQQPDGGGGSADESGLITDTSLQQPQDDNSIISRPSRHHHPQQQQQTTTTKPVVAKPTTVVYQQHQQTAKKPLLAGQLPCIKTPAVQSAIRYPSVPISHLKKYPGLNPPSHLHHLNRPVKKLRPAD